MIKIPLTVQGAVKLKAELQNLKSVERPAVIAAIAEARSHGDLSENAQLIEPASLAETAEGRVVFGATVDLEDLETSNKVTYQIVGDEEAEIKEFKISVSSPIARALIGKYAGDVAEVMAPGGIREYEVLDVKYI
jgi:transcription elongation factor GreA